MTGGQGEAAGKWSILHGSAAHMGGEDLVRRGIHLVYSVLEGSLQT